MLSVDRVSLPLAESDMVVSMVSLLLSDVEVYMNVAVELDKVHLWSK